MTHFLFCVLFLDLKTYTNGIFSICFLFFLILFIYLFTYFWLRWVFIAVRGFSLVAGAGATLCCSARASHCGGFSCCRARALGVQAQ